MENLPSPATLFRMKYLDRQAEELFHRAKMRLKPLFWLRDAARVSRVQAAQSLEALIDLSPQATGLAEEAWRERLGEFGEAALPQLTEMLRQLHQVDDMGTRRRLEELFISELRWREVAGVGALLECFDDLDAYGKSLACVALGLLKVQSAAQRMWGLYQEARANHQEPDFVGALWGLIDLGEARVAEALNELLGEEFFFYELFGFLALAGDRKALLPLLELAEATSAEERYAPLFAAVAIAHRGGPQAVIDELQRAASYDGAGTEASEIANQLMAIPLQNAEEHFRLFFHGFTPRDAQNAIDRM
jgi:hypothetical protein